MPDHEILELATKLRYDLTALQAKVTELLTMSAKLQPPDQSLHRCNVCDLHFKGPRALAEHQYVQHDGTEPDHWLQAEKLAATDATDVGEHGTSE